MSDKRHTTKYRRQRAKEIANKNAREERFGKRSRHRVYDQRQPVKYEPVCYRCRHAFTWQDKNGNIQTVTSEGQEVQMHVTCPRWW